jgi:hypothetical protein
MYNSDNSEDSYNSEDYPENSDYSEDSYNPDYSEDSEDSSISELPNRPGFVLRLWRWILDQNIRFF